MGRLPRRPLGGVRRTSPLERRTPQLRLKWSSHGAGNMHRQLSGVSPGVNTWPASGDGSRSSIGTTMISLCRTAGSAAVGALAAAVLFLVVPRRRAAAMMSGPYLTNRSRQPRRRRNLVHHVVAVGGHVAICAPRAVFVGRPNRSQSPMDGWLFLTTDLPWSEILLARTTSTTIRFTTRSHRTDGFRSAELGPPLD